MLTNPRNRSLTGGGRGGGLTLGTGRNLLPVEGRGRVWIIG